MPILYNGPFWPMLVFVAVVATGLLWLLHKFHEEVRGVTVARHPLWRPGGNDDDSERADRIEVLSLVVGAAIVCLTFIATVIKTWNWCSELPADQQGLLTRPVNLLLAVLFVVLWSPIILLLSYGIYFLYAFVEWIYFTIHAVKNRAELEIAVREKRERNYRERQEARERYARECEETARLRQQREKKERETERRAEAERLQIEAAREQAKRAADLQQQQEERREREAKMDYARRFAAAVQSCEMRYVRYRPAILESWPEEKFNDDLKKWLVDGMPIDVIEKSAENVLSVIDVVGGGGTASDAAAETIQRKADAERERLKNRDMDPGLRDEFLMEINRWEQGRVRDAYKAM